MKYGKIMLAAGIGLTMLASLTAPGMAAGQEQWADGSSGFEQSFELPEVETDGSIYFSSAGGNINAQDYYRWATPITSYIYKEDTGFMTVRTDFTSGKLTIKHLNENFEILSEKTITHELPVFGGFYKASDGNYYIFYGQDNESDDENREVIRVVKYDRDFTRLSALSIKGANTYTIYSAGSLRVAEYGDYLYVRTCHEMYASEKDGLHHEACFTLQIKTADMTLADQNWSFSPYPYGYVSHSFDQFIIIDDQKNIVVADHGDAYPRTIQLGRYTKKAGEASFNAGFSKVDVLEISGSLGDNATGVAMGGLEYSSDNYLVAFSSIPQDGTASSETGGRNAYLAVVSKSDLSLVGTVKLSDYPGTGTFFASAPQLVKISDSRFLVMWNETKSIGFSSCSVTGKMHYVLVDGAGSPVGEVKEAEMNVTDCSPIVSGSKVYWFENNSSGKYFIDSISTDGNSVSKIEAGAGSGAGSSSSRNSSSSSWQGSGSSSVRSGSSSSRTGSGSSSVKSGSSSSWQGSGSSSVRSGSSSSWQGSGSSSVRSGSSSSWQGSGSSSVRSGSSSSWQGSGSSSSKSGSGSSKDSPGSSSSKKNGSESDTSINPGSSAKTPGKSSSSSSSYLSGSDYRKIVNAKGDTLILGQTGIFAVSGVDKEKVSIKGKNGYYQDGLIFPTKKGSLKLVEAYEKGGKVKYRTVCMIKVEQPKLKSVLKLKSGAVKRLKLSGTKTQPDKWTSDLSSVASVSKDGTVTAKKHGEATVTAYIGSLKYECLVVVK